MRPSRKFYVIFLNILVATALILGACAGEQKKPDGGDGGDVDPNDNTFTYASSGQYKPFNYYDEKTNELTGFDVEIGKALAKEMDMEADPVTTPWQGIIAGLKAGRYDAILGSMSITEDRKEQVDFSDPYYVSGAQIFVQKDSPIKGADDLNEDTTIGVVVSSTFDEEARKYSNNIKNYQSDETALRDLDAGRLDAVITDRFVGLIAQQESGLENLQTAGDLLYSEDIGIAFRKEDDELREKVNKALKAIMDDGTYLDISKKYFGVDISGKE